MYQTESKIIDLDELKRQIVRWHLKNHVVVWTNGCFDILHPGHTDYLEKAKNKGSKLVIGLNSDESVKLLKGEGRPIMKEQDRAKMLAALEVVDAVILFSEETPEALIQQLDIDILAKGADYEGKEIAGAESVKARGGKVELIEFLEGYSTSGLIEKIKG